MKEQQGRNHAKFCVKAVRVASSPHDLRTMVGRVSLTRQTGLVGLPDTACPITARLSFQVEKIGPIRA